MCGRFTLFDDKYTLKDEFEVELLRMNMKENVRN